MSMLFTTAPRTVLVAECWAKRNPHDCLGLITLPFSSCLFYFFHRFYYPVQLFKQMGMAAWIWTLQSSHPESASPKIINAITKELLSWVFLRQSETSAYVMKEGTDSGVACRIAPAWSFVAAATRLGKTVELFFNFPKTLHRSDDPVIPSSDGWGKENPNHTIFWWVRRRSAADSLPLLTPCPPPHFSRLK
jgi:hypothetical protein